DRIAAAGNACDFVYDGSAWTLVERSGTTSLWGSREDRLMGVRPDGVGLSGAGMFDNHRWMQGDVFPAVRGSILGVSVASDATVWAGGIFDVPGTSQPAVLRWTDTGWTYVAAPFDALRIVALSQSDVWVGGFPGGIPVHPGQVATWELAHFDG